MKHWMYSLWAIIDVLLFVAALSLWITAPEFWTLNISITAFAFSLGVVLLIIKFEQIKIFVRSRYFEKVLFHSLNTILVFSILGMLNYLGNKNFKEFDLTKEKRNSLTDQSLKVLESLKAPLKLQLFARREEWGPMLNLLKLYQAANRLISIDAIDTDLRPDLVKSNGITQNGTVVIQYATRKATFPLVDERSVTNAFLKIIRDDQIILYLVKGHQELSCSETSQEGMSILCSRLKAQNYVLKELDLSRSLFIPKDASAVLVLGPISGFLGQETEQIKTYLKNGGSLFLALAPAFKAELYDNLVDLVREFGLDLGKDVVIDRLSTVQGAEATIPIVERYNLKHPITNGFTQRTIFPLSSSVRLLKGKDTAELLAETSAYPGSWAETDLKGITRGKASFQENQDLKGPVGLLGVAEGAGISESRVALLGSSSFLINAYQNQSGNTTLFLNTISWMVNDEGIISFNRPGVEEFPVILSAQHIQMIFVISILVVPIVFFGAAIFIYRRRRLL
jgi:ABC-type uncharacterized transport system involved in gliding motility auxiliary subunit